MQNQAREAWIGSPSAGHYTYALNIPTMEGWGVEVFRSPEECRRRARELGLTLVAPQETRIA